MSMILQFSTVVKAVTNLESRKDLVCGNIQKSRLLIDRCVQFQGLLQSLDNNAKTSPSLEPCIIKFKNIIEEATALVDNFCQPGSSLLSLARLHDTTNAHMDVYQDG
jgi:hypothetical protein